jgi:hypothetical protein
MAERHPGWVNGIDAFEARLASGLSIMAEGKGDALDPLRVRSGIRDAPGNPGLVTVGTNQISVNPFQAVIADRDRPGDGPYLVTLDALKQLPLQGADPSQSRIDLVLAVVSPDVPNGFEVRVLPGQTSATPQRPTPASTTFLELAEIRIPPAGTAPTRIDSRRFTTGLGGVLPVRTAADRPNTAASSTLIYRLDSSTLEVQRSGVWTTYRPPRSEGWTPAPLVNGWVNYGSEFNTAAYTRTDDGWVRLRGLVKNGVVDPVGATPIFTLPTPGYRPPGQYLFVVATNPNDSGRVDVKTDGRVVCLKGNNGWVSLDGIAFATY